MHLDMAKFGVVPASAAAPIASQPAIPPPDARPVLTVESTPSGADIEIDGVFVGNTPSTLNVPAGDHDVSVKKKGFADWSKKINITGGNIHLSAELEQAPSRNDRTIDPSPVAH